VYRLLLQLFPLYKRVSLRVELSIPVSNESIIRLREVKKALFNNSFSDSPTNFLSLIVRITAANEETTSLVQQLRGLCDQRVKDLEAEMTGAS